MSRQYLDPADFDIGVVCQQFPSIDPTVLDQQAIVQVDGPGLDCAEHLLNIGCGQKAVATCRGLEDKLDFCYRGP
jgi:hypothetical protein